jgi:hypothetical protein
MDFQLQIPTVKEPIPNEMLHGIRTRTKEEDINNNLQYVGFADVGTVTMNSSLFWDMTPCSPVKVNRRFGRTYRLHLEGRRVSQARNQHVAGSQQRATLMVAGYWLVSCIVTFMDPFFRSFIVFFFFILVDTRACALEACPP